MASATPIAALNHRFEIPGIAKLVEGRGGMPAVRINSPEVSGEIYLHGAHVTSWKPEGSEEVLFVSSKTKWQNGTAIRGGVPICFPWFSERAEDPKSPAHGMVRTKAWQLEAITHADSNVTNHGDLPFRFEEALHTYYRVGNVEAAKVHGLNGTSYLDKTAGKKEKSQHGKIQFAGETDRVYKKTSAAVEIEDPVLRRRILISKEDSRDTVVWNPWIAKAKALGDLAADEWRQFVCVETCNVGDHAVTLGEAQAHTMSALISLNGI